MPGQEAYYNHFGEQHKADILASKEPHLWTTDAHKNGDVYQEMKRRVANQEAFVDKYFDKAAPVLDIGCGFGRQAYLLAKKGYYVKGIDTSEEFVEIAKSIFSLHQLKGDFACTDIMKDAIEGQYKNILLFDVLEHIFPFRRRSFIRRLRKLTYTDGHVVMSLPNEQDDGNWKKFIKQFFRYFTNKEEHPYIIPKRKNMERSIRNLYAIVDSVITAETIYYVLEAVPVANLL